MNDEQVRRMVEYHRDQAYSFSRYGAKQWRRCIKWLTKVGYDVQEINAIMLSKIPRWAADRFDDATVGSLAFEIGKEGHRPASVYVSGLVIGTTPYPF